MSDKELNGVLDEILRELGVMSWRVAERPVSRRNSVYIIEADNERERRLFVWKQYEQGAPFYEAETLTLLRGAGVAVPEVLAVRPEGLLLSHIAGRNLCDELEYLEKENADGFFLAKLITAWLAAYYAAVDGARGDINPRNFIFDTQNRRLFGIDFEDTAFQSRLYDTAALFAHVLTLNPQNTAWKRAWARRAALYAARVLGLDYAALKEAFRQALTDTARRRGEIFPEEIFTALD